MTYHTEGSTSFATPGGGGAGIGQTEEGIDSKDTMFARTLGTGGFKWPDNDSIWYREALIAEANALADRAMEILQGLIRDIVYYKTPGTGGGDSAVAVASGQTEEGIDLHPPIARLNTVERINVKYPTEGM